MTIKWLLFFLFCTTFAFGDEPQNKNPLATLPSKERSNIEKFKTMEDNSWLNLGQAATCDRFPKKNVACGRAWAGQMTYASSLGGAFFCGTGAHGATPDGYYMDDLWFYDLNAHKWICLYPGATAETQLKLDENGFEVTLDGVQNPVSYLSHAYCNTTFVEHLNKYMAIHRPCPWWTKALPQRAKWLGIQEGENLSYNYGKLNLNCRHPIFWNATKNTWERTFVKNKGGPEKSFCGTLEYIPSMKLALNIYNGKIWLYDFEKEEWTDSKIEKGPSGYDSNACLDPKNDMLYLTEGKSFYVLDIKEKKWKLIEAEGQPVKFGSTNGNFINYDSANEVVLYCANLDDIWVYDIKKNKWEFMTKTAPQIPWKKMNYKYLMPHGFYDVKNNVHLIYRASDSGYNDATWLAYRYKNKPEKEKVKE